MSSVAEQNISVQAMLGQRGVLHVREQSAARHPKLNLEGETPALAPEKTPRTFKVVGEALAQQNADLKVIEEARKSKNPDLQHEAAQALSRSQDRARADKSVSRKAQRLHEQGVKLAAHEQARKAKAAEKLKAKKRVIASGMTENVSEKLEALQEIEGEISQVEQLVDKRVKKEKDTVLAAQGLLGLASEDAVEDYLENLEEQVRQGRTGEVFKVPKPDQPVSPEKVKKLYDKTIKPAMEQVRQAIELSGLKLPADYEKQLMEDLGIVLNTPEGATEPVMTLTEDSPLMAWALLDEYHSKVSRAFSKNMTKVEAGDTDRVEAAFFCAHQKVIAEQQMRVVRLSVTQLGTRSLVESAKAAAGIEGNVGLEGLYDAWLGDNGDRIQRNSSMITESVKDTFAKLPKLFGSETFKDIGQGLFKLLLVLLGASAVSLLGGSLAINQLLGTAAK